MSPYLFPLASPSLPPYPTPLGGLVIYFKYSVCTCQSQAAISLTFNKVVLMKFLFSLMCFTHVDEVHWYISELSTNSRFIPITYTHMYISIACACV